MSTIRGFWDSIPNAYQSLIMAIVIAALDYIVHEQKLTWQGLGIALAAAAWNWFNTHAAEIKATDKVIGTVFSSDVPTTVPATTYNTDGGNSSKPVVSSEEVQ